MQFGRQLFTLVLPVCILRLYKIIPDVIQKLHSEEKVKFLSVRDFLKLKAKNINKNI